MSNLEKKNLIMTLIRNLRSLLLLLFLKVKLISLLNIVFFSRLFDIFKRFFPRIKDENLLYAFWSFLALLSFCLSISLNVFIGAKYSTLIMLALNFYLIVTFVNIWYTANFKKSKTKTLEKYPKLSIIDIIKTRKTINRINTIYLLLTSLIIYIISFKLLDINISNTVLFVLLFFSILIGLELIIFNYRVSKGLYGNSESEAREIIQFIIDNSDDIDFSDGNKSKSVFSPEDLKELADEFGIKFPPIPGFGAINNSKKIS